MSPKTREQTWPALLRSATLAYYRGIDDYTFQLLDGTVLNPEPRAHQVEEFRKVLNGGVSDYVVEVDNTYYWKSIQTGDVTAVWLPKLSQPQTSPNVLVLLDGFREGPLVLRNSQMVVDAVEIKRRFSYVYPDGWRTSLDWSYETPTHNNDLFAFGRNKARRSAISSDCIVCGSRGGQATLIGIWRSGCHKPAVVINAGCSRPGLEWNNGRQPVVLIAGGKDTFKGRRDNDSYFRDLWNAVPSDNQDTTALVFFEDMEHKLPSAFAAYVVPLCIEFCLSGNMLDRSAVDDFVSKMPGPGRIQTNRWVASWRG